LKWELVILNTGMPAVLVELAFISNKDDGKHQSLGISEKGPVETSLSFTTFLPLLKGKLCLFYAKIWLFVLELWGSKK